MGIIRVKKTKNYTVMSNYHLKDKNLSLKAQGLLSIILSLPDDWDYSVAGLVAIVKDGKSAVQSALQELEFNDYVVRRRIKDDKGRILDWEYIIFENPAENNIPESERKSINSPLTDFQDMGNADVDNRDVEGMSQLNTKEPNTKEPNTNQKSTVAGASSKNHSQVYKQRNTLSDDLESGKDIDEQKKSKKKSPKDKFRDECLDIIEKQFVMYPAHISDLLADYFDFISAVPDNKENLPKRVKTVSAWKKKLHKLVELVAEGYDIEKLIQQSLDNKAYVFYPLQSTQSKSKSTGHREGNQENVVMSDPDYIRKRLEEDESEEWY